MTPNLRRRTAGGTRTILPALFALALAAGASATGPPPPRTPQEPAPERLTYTITYLGIAVARAMLEQRPATAADGELLVRASSRTTAFWDRFFHIRNTYTTRLDPGSLRPSVYEREVDQKGLRFRWVEWYAPAGGADEGAAAARRPGQIPAPGLPARPESYRAEGPPDTLAVQTVPAGHENLFSALWWMRYADWEHLREARRILWVDGRTWELTFTRYGPEPTASPEGRVPAWVIRITMERRDPDGAAGPAGPERTDYVTRELVRENAVVTFWVEQAPARRPLAVRVERPKLVVRGVLREPFEDERLVKRDDASVRTARPAPGW
jgi:hypothetical protein